MALHLYITLVILLLLSGLFSGSEIALFSLSNIKVRKLVRSRKKGAKALKRLKDNPHRLLVTILICNNVVNIAAASIATVVAIDAFGSTGVGIATGIMTLLILIFGEITPKSYFHQKNEKASLVLARPLYALTMVLYPVIIAIEGVSKGVLKLTGMRSVKSKITEEELIAALSLSKEAGVIERDEEEMMQNVIDFGDIRVKEVMIPRKHMISLTSDQMLIEAISKMLETRYSRMPVYAHGTRKIIGIINLRSVLKHIKSKEMDIPIIKVISPVIFVMDDEKLDSVFDKLRENAMHMAIVRDRKKRVVGLVTMEDLLEEIVGEIYDEADKRRFRMHFIDKKTAIVRGDTPVQDLKEWIGIPVKTKAKDVSEMVSARFNGNPKPGNAIKLKNFIIIVKDVSKKDPSRVTRIKITKRRGKIRK